MVDFVATRRRRVDAEDRRATERRRARPPASGRATGVGKHDEHDRPADDPQGRSLRRGARRSRRRAGGHRSGAPPRRYRRSRRRDQAAARLDRPADDRRRETQHRPGLQGDDAARDRRRLRARRAGADRRRAGSLRHHEQRRGEDAGALLHVRRQAVRPRRVDVAAARGADRRPAGAGQGHDRPRRDQPEGTRSGRPRRAPRVQGGGAEAAGQPRARRRGGGGDRLAALRADRSAARHPRRPAPLRRSDHPVGVAEPGRRRRRRQPRGQGHRRTRARRVRREMGPRPGEGPAFEQQGDRRQPRVASGRGARDPRLVPTATRRSSTAGSTASVRCRRAKRR